MGTSHFKSNIVGKAGTETINGFTSVSASSVYTSSKMRIGSTQYLLVGGLNTEASIVVVATALTTTPTGSLYLSTAGKLWFFDGADTATPSTTGLIL